MSNTARIRRKGPIEVPVFHITNRRNSTSLDSTFSGAPPGYTSQKGRDSPVQTLHSSDDDDSDEMMHSFAEADLSHMLPSPYSVEDFQSRDEHQDDSDEYGNSSVPSSSSASRIITPRLLNATSQISLLPVGGYSTPSPQLIPGVNPRSFPSLSTGDLLMPQIILQPPTTNPRATNYVSVSRKNTWKKSSIFRQKIIPSFITGEFNIDPNLSIPPALLNSSPESNMRRKNLLLEVENGGIDVDVNLIASSVSRSMRHSVMTLGNNLGRASSTSTVSRTHYRTSPSRPISRRSVRDAAQPQCSQLVSEPTFIDLRLKDNFRRPGATAANDFPLVARIHAPRPRPPFHLLASTMEMSHHDTFGGPSPKTHPPTKGSAITAHDLQGKFLSKSNLTIHLPHTFHGPLTVHVAAGDIDDHVHLSEEVKESVLVLSETSVSRVYFVGSLREDMGSDFTEVDEDEYRESRVPSRMSAVRGYRVPERVASRQGLNRDAGMEGKADAWHGDKVDIVVGRGHVYLQFLDEQKPFGRKKCFWKCLIPGSK